MTRYRPHLTATDPGPWIARAACLPADEPDLWFDGDDAEAAGHLTRRHKALKLCAACPVRQACLTYALSTNQPHGIWGGLTTNQRRRLVKATP